MKLAKRPSTATRKRALDVEEDSSEDETIDIVSAKRIKVNTSAQDEDQPDSPNDLGSKREAAVRRLQTVWDSIIERYSEPEMVAHADIIDLETGTIVQDNGHLESLELSEESLWARQEVKRKNSKKAEPTMFNSILDVPTDEDEEHEVIEIEDLTEEEELEDDDDEQNDDDDGVYLSTLGLDETELETKSSPNQIPNIRAQMSRKIRQLRDFEQSKVDDSPNYDALLLPSSDPVEENEIKVTTTEQIFETRFMNFFKQNQHRPNPLGFFYEADTAAQRLRQIT